MGKFKKVKGIVLLIVLIIASTATVYAESDRSWSLEHKYADMNFVGYASFVEGKFFCKSSVLYFGMISGKERGLSWMSVDTNYNLVRNDNDEVGNLMISTKNRHNGNCVKVYVADNHRVPRSQYKDYLSRVNVDLRFGTISNYVSYSFSLYED